MRFYGILLLNLNLYKNRVIKTEVLRFTMNISHVKKKEDFKLGISNLEVTILCVCVFIFHFGILKFRTVMVKIDELVNTLSELVKLCFV